MKGFLVSFVLPVIIIFLAFSVSVMMGLIVSLAVVLYTVWRMRADIYCMIASKKFETNHSDAYMWFEKALATKRMRPFHTLFYAYMLLRDGVLDKAEALINKTTYMHRGKLASDVKLSAELNLALIKWKRGDLPGAISDLEELYIDGYKSTVMYGTLGYLYIISGDMDKAYKFNAEAIEYADSDSIIMDNWANTLLLRGDIEDACEIYESLMEQNPSFMEAYYNYGAALYKKGDKEKALDMMNKALAMEEKYLSELTHDKIRQIIATINEE